MRTSERYGSDDHDDESSTKSSSKKSESSSPASSWESPTHLDMSHGGEHVVQLHPKFELTLPAPLMQELLKVKEDDEPEPRSVPDTAVASVGHVSAQAIDVYAQEAATGEIPDGEFAEGEASESEEADEQDDSKPTSKPAARPVAVPISRPVQRVAPRQSVADQIMQQLDLDTREEFQDTAAAPALAEAYTPEPPAPVEGAAMPAAPAAAEYMTARPQETADYPLQTGGDGNPPGPPAPPTERGAFYYPEQPAPEPVPARSEHAYDIFAMPEDHDPNRYAAMQMPGIAPELHTAALNQAELTGERRGARRGLVVGYIIRSALAHRQQRRLEQEMDATKQEHTQQIAELDAQHAEMYNRMLEQQRQIDQYRYQPQTRTVEQSPVTSLFTGEQTLIDTTVPAARAREQPRASEQAATLPQQQEQPRQSEQPHAVEQPRFEQPLQASAPNFAPLPTVNRAEFSQPASVLRGEQAAPAPSQAPAEQVPQDQLGEAIKLEEGQHVDRESWYSVVRGNDGKVVEGAINYGQALKEEQRAEQAPVFSSSQTQSSGQVDNQQAQAGGALGSAGLGTMLSSGQVDMGHELAAGGSKRADVQHRLKAAAKNNPVVATLASPWLWAGVVVLLITFFAAALL